MKMHKKLLPPELLLLAQICTKSFVGLGFTPDPTGGAYSTPPDPLAGLGGGALGIGKEGREGEKEGREGRGGSGGEGKGGEGVLECPNPELASLIILPRVTMLVFRDNTGVILLSYLHVTILYTCIISPLNLLYKYWMVK